MTDSKAEQVDRDELQARYSEMGINERAVAMADNGDGDPWELLGYFREKLKQAEWETDRARSAAVDLAKKVATLSPMGLLEEVRFLLNRIGELDWSLSKGDIERDWHGHVAPALSRLTAKLPKLTGEGM